MSRIGLGRHGGIEDNAGDPLDGLVNLFDVGIVLAIAFLIAGVGLATNASDEQARQADKAPTPAAKVRVLPKPGSEQKARGHGQPVGTAYRLADGRIVIVSPR
ncbi:MAG TPA: DUF2149 domain-containing protein [Solirubrobacterales bacterium]|nr:DUF2149 domain-containing protein [Solirubrobacterales bacterium]